MKFKPCIDLHNGKVKQIIGSSLGNKNRKVIVNFQSEKPPSYFAKLYKNDNLSGGHVIMLGKGNEAAAKDALSAYYKNLHIGGGINLENALYWMKQGASALIVTSYVFKEGKIYRDNLEKMIKLIGKKNLVLDLSCRLVDNRYYIATDMWQNIANEEITLKLLDYLSDYCSEFLIHAADVEGKCQGVEIALIEKLGRWVTIPTTYAGGVRSVADLDLINKVGCGKLDVTVGSALDIFGGTLPYNDVVEWHNRHNN